MSVKIRMLHVFALEATAQLFFDGQFQYLVEHGLTIHVAATPGTGPDLTKDFTVRNGVAYHPLTVPRSLSPKEDLQCIIQLCRLIRQEHIDIVVGHTPKGALLSMIAARLAGIKRRVYFRHGLIYTTSRGMKRLILINVERFTSALSTHIIDVSPSVKNLCVSDGINRVNKTQIFGEGTCGGIDTLNTFNPSIISSYKLSELRDQHGISKDDFVVGFCGRLCPDKGMKELYEGFCMFKNAHPDVKAKLLLVGGFDDRDILPIVLRRNLQSDEDVILTGEVQTDIPYYYALMDAFVFPSHREGFGMASIEAAAMGIPVLAAKSHGCVDTIINGETGYHIELSSQDICDKLTALLDHNIRELFGARGRKRATEYFERTKLWPQILAYYQSL